MLLPSLLLSFAVSASAIDIILPLYVYPGTDGAVWIPVTKAAAAFPNVKWQVIVNPNTGPGTTATNPYPNDDWIAGITLLNKLSNVKMLGYVDTLWGNRPIADVKSDLDKYAAWEKYRKGELSMDGIFFDDVPSIFDFQDHKGTQAGNETYFQNISSYARTTISSDPTPVVFNSGNPGASSFFAIGDTMVEFENKYSAYQGQTTLNTITSDGGALNQSAIIVYSWPKTSTPTDLTNVIKTMKNRNVQQVGVTDDCCYNALNGTLLMMLAAACDAADSSTSTQTAANGAGMITGSAVLATGVSVMVCLFTTLWSMT